jgi:hypothetical protein
MAIHIYSEKSNRWRDAYTELRRGRRVAVVSLAGIGAS